MKKIIKYILSFILMISILITALVTIVANTVASKQYVVGKLDEINFYARTADIIKDTFNNYIMQSGMDESVFENIFQEDKLRQDVNILIDAIYENKELNVEVDSVKEKLTANIDKYLEENKLKVNNTEEIKNFINTIADTYKNGVLYSGEVIKQITPITSKAINAIHSVLPLMYAANAVLVILLIVFNWKGKINLAKYVGISLFAAGLTLIIINIIINISINFSGIEIINAVVADLIKTLVGDILNFVLYTGIAFAIVGFICIMLKVMSIKEKATSKH